MHSDRAVTRPSSEPVSMRPIVDRQTPVKTLPSLAVDNQKNRFDFSASTMQFNAIPDHVGDKAALWD